MAQVERRTSSLSLSGACWLAEASRDARFSALSSSRTSRTIGSGLLRSSGRGRKLVRVAIADGCARRITSRVPQLSSLAHLEEPSAHTALDELCTAS